jgi:hypothetical protein
MTMPRAFEFRFFIAALLVCCATSVSLIVWPYRWSGADFERTQMAIAIATVLGILLVYVSVFFSDRTPSKAFRAAILLLACALLLMSATLRQYEYRDLDWAFRGKVEEKYRSTNHDARTLVVTGVRYESIDPAFWSDAHVGDEISKNPSSIMATLNGKRRRFVPDNLLQSMRVGPDA